MHVKHSPRKDWSRFVWTDEDLEPEASGPVRPGGTLRPDPVWVRDLGLLRLIWKFGERLPSGRRGRPRVEGRERVLRVVMTDEEWKRLEELARVIRALTHRSVSEGTLLGLIGSEWLERARLGSRGSPDHGGT